MLKNLAGTARTRRYSRVLAGGIATAATIALLAGCSSSDAAPAASGTESALSGSVVVADYGGPTHDARATAYFDGFTADTGVTVTSADYTDAIANAQLDGEAGDYDLIQTSTDTLLKYQDNLEELPADVPRGDLLPENIQDYAAGAFTIGITQGWLTDTFSDGGPKDWADFFDTTKYPGKRAWPGSAGSYDASFEIALLADGVAPEDLYPIDFDRAVKKLNELKPDMVFYSSYPEVQQLLSSGTASIAVSVTGQFTALQRAGLDVTVQWNEAFLSPNFFVVPTTSKNKENAFALAKAMADAENEATFTTATHYGPALSATFDLLDADVVSQLPNAPEHDKAIQFDEQYRADNLDTYLDTYTAWLAQ
ncbi:extracellular solute-binding protein [Herbiconiux sp.]|uniref:extracellular solute-binding protein n=1 Tax=Herbiconiux sp. TaxID=1871186 RepID=UPI0025BC11A8|nr:extracellular solute-binding protein [Herbiconiux sp.]